MSATEAIILCSLFTLVFVTHIAIVQQINRRLRVLDKKVDCLGMEILRCDTCGRIIARHSGQESATCRRATERRMALERKAAKTR